MAAMNLIAGLVIASHPERQDNLETVRSWTDDWVHGVNIYQPDESPDYPPNAIVTLSPLAAFPAKWLIAAWAAFNVVLALLAPYLALRSIRPTLTLSEAALPMCMLLCWGGFRTLLQFTLVAVVLGLFSIVLADKRRTLAGICLGFALIKPQVAAPFILWALLTLRFRLIAAALATASAAFAIYCVRVAANPVSVAANHLAALRSFYTGGAAMAGLSELRPLIARIVPGVTARDSIVMTVGLALLAVVCVVGSLEGKRKISLLYSAPALAGLWSLLVFRHLAYGFVLLLPLAALLWLDTNPATATFRKRVFWFLQIAMMADVPGLWRRFGHPAPVPPAAGGWIDQVDRVVMIVLFLCVLKLALTETPASNQLIAS